MKITDDIKYIGVNDHNIDMFEGQYPVPEGMAYNSYVIVDEKIAVMDTIEANFTDEWLSNLENALNGRKADYLVVHHMEPDHSSAIKLFADRYPEAVILASAPAFRIMENYFGTGFEGRKEVIKEGSTLELGKHTLSFISAPLVHWPEVMMSYDSCDKVLFSADAFGKFGTNDTEEEWACEARRYYFGIVGKFGTNVQAVLKKTAALDIEKICPLHGPVLSENLQQYISLYDTWSSYKPEDEGVTVAYTSVYGNTKKAAIHLADELKAKNIKVEIFDLARDDMSEAVESAFRYNKIVLATTTYNNDIFPFMHNFILALQERNYQARKVALIENGSWGPLAAKVMKSLLEGFKDIEIIDTVTIKGVADDAVNAKLTELAEKLAD